MNEIMLGLFMAIIGAVGLYIIYDDIKSVIKQKRKKK